MYTLITCLVTELSSPSILRGLYKLDLGQKSFASQLCVRVKPRANGGVFRPNYFAFDCRPKGLNCGFLQAHPIINFVKTYTSTNLCRQLSTTLPNPKKEKVTVTFIKKDGTRIIAEGKEGDSLYDIVINNHVDIDGYGACEGTASCSTCHLILKKDDYEKLDDKPSDEEQDLLDLAYELTETSRLGCMVHMTKELNGLEVYVPEGINDVREI